MKYYSYSFFIKVFCYNYFINNYKIQKLNPKADGNWYIWKSWQEYNKNTRPDTLQSHIFIQLCFKLANKQFYESHIGNFVIDKEKDIYK